MLCGTHPHLERDHDDRSEHGQERGQHDALDAQYQQHDRRSDGEVEVQADPAADVDRGDRHPRVRHQKERHRWE
jgi:hypothetical protein